ncbi:hypothetical protein K402DRAFT_51314 [Aulographum hederae CBS 113979]|uniref:Uncharacterized protein n=1 Tax=Aulographum hederae CBS 113979 TaxID=1176131 RepID=A0A6G1H3C1_9PEZI|nr:hypothetical protein K402DRAFT_51314 [Aulographum hederae CBS 113979]
MVGEWGDDYSDTVARIDEGKRFGGRELKPHRLTEVRQTNEVKNKTPEREIRYVTMQYEDEIDFDVEMEAPGPNRQPQLLPRWQGWTRPARIIVDYGNSFRSTYTCIAPHNSRCR